MKAVTDEIREVIAAAEPLLITISAQVARKSAGGEEWSRKEILGHLVDSTANNLQRVVRGALGTGIDLPVYDQNAWVAVQRYQEMDWMSLVALFRVNALQFCRVVDGLSEECLENKVNVGKEDAVTVRFLVVDYLRHLKMHMAQIVKMDDPFAGTP
jgi:hypothetical protein